MQNADQERRASLQIVRQPAWAVVLCDPHSQLVGSCADRLLAEQDLAYSFFDQPIAQNDLSLANGGETAPQAFPSSR
jgi:hypothetical protein